MCVPVCKSEGNKGSAETTTPRCDEFTVPKLGTAFKLNVAAFSAGNAPVDDPRHHHGVVIVARTVHAPRVELRRTAACRSRSPAVVPPSRRAPFERPKRPK